MSFNPEKFLAYSEIIHFPFANCAFKIPIAMNLIQVQSPEMMSARIRFSLIWMTEIHLSLDIQQPNGKVASTHPHDAGCTKTIL